MSVCVFHENDRTNVFGHLRSDPTHRLPPLSLSPKALFWTHHCWSLSYFMRLLQVFFH